MRKTPETIPVGSVFVTRSSGSATVIKYEGCNQITVQFEDGTTKITASKELRTGSLKNNFAPYVHGVGFLGEGSYKAKAKGQKSGSTIEYEVWRGMLRRCYDVRSFIKHPTYVGCTVEQSWHNFQVFAEWYTKQKGFQERWHLDKDLLNIGNKVYSVTSCCLIPARVNSLFTGANKGKRGSCPKGVHFCNTKKMYIAQIHREGAAQDYLGTYSTKDQAFAAYKVAKESYVKQIAKEYKEDLPERVYENLVNYVVNADD
jgi:hypothetical protein